MDQPLLNIDQKMDELGAVYKTQRSGLHKSALHISKKRMKIIHIMGANFGGAETYSTDVMLSLHKAGMDSDCCDVKTRPALRRNGKAGLKLEPSVLDTPFRFLQKWRLAKLIEREKPDLVHTWMRRAASILPQMVLYR